MFFFIMMVVFLVCLALLFVRIVPPYTAAIVVRMGKPIRSIGPGTHFVFWPLEWVGEPISIKEKVIDDKMSTETESEEVVPLDFSIEYAPYFAALVTFLGFSSDQIESAIKQRVKSLLSIAVRKRKDRDAVYDQMNYVAQEVQQEFLQKFSSQYGVYIRFLIDDPELPPKLVDAEVEREIQEKTNEKRKLDLTNLKKLANDLVQAAEKRGEKLSFDAALKRVQVHLGIVKEQHQFYGLDSQTSGVLGSILSPLIKNLGGKNHGDQSQPK